MKSIPAAIIFGGGEGGGSGTGSYTDLTHKPKINGIELNGDKTSADLGIANINDESSSTNSVYSSDKTDDLLSGKADKSDTYTKDEVDDLIPDISGKADKSDTYTKDEVDDLIPDTHYSEISPLNNSVNGNIRGLKLQGNSYKSKNLIHDVTYGKALGGNETDGYNIVDGVDGKGLIACVEIENSATYTLKDYSATTNRFRILLSNSKLTDTPSTTDIIQLISSEHRSEPYTFTNSDNYKYAYLGFANDTQLVTDFKAQFEEGSIATSYEPYGIIEPSGDVKSFTRNLLNTYNRLFSFDSNIIIEDNGTSFRRTLNNTETSTVYSQCTFGDISQFKPNHTYKVVTEILERTAGRFMLVSAPYLAPKGIFNVEQESKDSVGIWVSTLTTIADFTDCVTVARSYFGFSAGENGTIKVRVRIYDIDDVSGLTDEEIKALSFVPYAGSTVHTDRPLLSVGDIKNELIVNPDGSGEFVERVEKVDLGNLAWAYISENEFFSSDGVSTKIKQGTNNLICSKYETISSSIGASSLSDKSVSDNTNGYLRIKDMDYTDVTAFKSAMSGVYLYYELETPSTTHLSASEVNELLSLKTYADATHIDTDGCPFEVSYFTNEGVASVDVKVNKVKSDVDEIYDRGFAKGKNLLNPIFPTTTSNGVTLTNNGDGTFTLNGTASSQVTFSIPLNFTIEPGKRYYYYGCPVGGGTEPGYRSCLRYGGWDIGNGNSKIYSESDLTNTIYFLIQMTGGITANNVLFKPMVTEFPSSYADFELYAKNNVELSVDVSNILNSSEVTFTEITNPNYTVSELKALRKGNILMIYGRVEVISGDEYPLGKTYIDVATLSNVTINWSAEDFLVSANGDYKPIQLASENTGSDSIIKLRGGTVGGIYIFRTIVFLIR